MLVFERCGWWCWPEEGTTLENEPLRSFSGVCGWWLSWRDQPTRKRAQMLVFERCGGWCWPDEGPTPENEQSCSSSGWCWQEEGPTPENEQSCSFSVGVGGGAGQRKLQSPKTSATARFRGRGGVWVLVVVVVREVLLAKGTFNPRKQAQQLVFGEGCGSLWWWLSGRGGHGGQRKVQTPKTSAMARFRGCEGWW